MTKTVTPRRISRRDFLKIGGGVLLATAGAKLLPAFMRRGIELVDVASAQTAPPDLFFAGTDGWIYLPPTPAIPPYHPDTLAPAPFTTYIFGFRNVLGLTPAQIANQKMKAQHTAPLFWARQEVEFRLKLTNLGLQMRPDLTDAHTVHWHGFRDAIPYFDGEPHGSVAVPVGKEFTYVYRPHDPGTYMFHCHVEDVEHVHMGMTGLVFVRPQQDGNTALYPSGKYAYNDGDGSTGFDREFAMMLTEVWAEAHWDDAHIQLPEWSDYRADFALLNGRVYPDTLAPNGSIDPFNPITDANGDLIPTPGYEHLQYQPLSSLVQCNAGERVLLRFANLGFMQSVMTLTGIKMRVVGEDATPKRGRDGTDTSYWTDSLSIYPGASYDAIFIAPPYQGPAPYDTYLLYNRSYRHSNNLEAGGFGGQMTEVRVFPSGTLPPQTIPNT
jgi:FtsP/CotA-like multicopper oxidase with cupredoxin domain